MTKIIDTHVHYNLDGLFEHWPEYWQEAQAAGVSKSLVVGTTLETSFRAVEIAQTSPDLLAAVGIHPNYAAKAPESYLESLEKLLQNEKVAALGEIGLDFFRSSKDAPEYQESVKTQLNCLEQQLLLAKKSRKPAIFHVRDTDLSEESTTASAYWLLLKTVQKVSFDLPFILHCVSGPQRYLVQALEMGAYVGIAGNCTYKNAHQIRELIKLVPQERLLLETDAPFLPPAKHRGKACHPKMIVETAGFLESELELDLSLIFENTTRLFPQLDETNKRPI